jgi:transcription elongation factor Elf1
MNCPSCGHIQSRVIDTQRKRDGLRRHRVCSKCGHRYQTLERIELWDPAVHGYVAVVDEQDPVVKAFAEMGGNVVRLDRVNPQPVEEPAAAKKRPSNRRWHPAGVPAGVCEEAAPLLLEWWNESRRLKHGGQAVWSERAWLASVDRVIALPNWQQMLLCHAGVEHGWQALKPEYLKEELAKPTGEGRPMPKDPAMLAALESWPKQTA